MFVDQYIYMLVGTHLDEDARSKHPDIVYLLFDRWE
jgi:hypothetical protein